jgi:hypothetical protein
MSLGEAVTLSFKVIADWRVIVIAITVLLIWAALRYVGSVYHKRPLPRRRIAAPPSPKASLTPSRAASRAGAETESMKDLIE